MTADLPISGLPATSLGTCWGFLLKGAGNSQAQLSLNSLNSLMTRATVSVAEVNYNQAGSTEEPTVS